MPKHTSARQCPPIRTEKACVACRSKKVRCLRDEGRDQCRRCRIMKDKCEYQVTQQQPRNDDILSNLAIAASRTPSIKMEDVAQSLADIHRQIFELPTGKGTETPEHSSGAERTGINATLTAERAEEYLTRFRHISPTYFPFVVLENDWNFASMQNTNPLLLLGILVAMSADSPRLQRRLDDTFRKLATAQVYVEGSKSLDILQGLLVFAAWYPAQQKPDRTSFSNFLGLIATMVRNLQLDEEPETRRRKTPEKLRLHEKRALLGCYYLSSAYSYPPRRLNTLEFGHFYPQALMDIDNHPQVLSDYNVVKMVRLQKEIEDAMKAESQQAMRLRTQQIPSYDYSLVQIRYLISRVESKMNYKSSIMSNSVSLNLTYSFCKINVYAIALSSTSEDLIDPQSIRYCIEALKAFLDVLIGADVVQYQYFTFVDWCRLIGTTANMFRLIKLIANRPDPDISQFSPLFHLGTHLDTLDFRMSELSNSNQAKVEGPNMFYLWHAVLPIVREKYSTLVNSTLQPETPMPRLYELCPMLNGTINSTQGDFSEASSSTLSDGFDWCSLLNLETEDIAILNGFDGMGAGFNTAGIQ